MESRGINVLSLFNGMGSIWVALDRLGVKVNKRYSSEIDKYANKVNDYNYPDTIQLGDARNIKGEDLEKIDLIVGGSPCQGFSFAGKRLNFDDPRSKLFFEFVRLIDECKPKYFLLENVRMAKKSQDVITDYLMVEPKLINSSLVSAQNRERLYWTNIPKVGELEDKGLVLADIISVEGLGFTFYDGDLPNGIENRIQPNQNYAESSQSLKRFKRNTKNLNSKSLCLTKLGYKGMAANGMTNVIVDNEWRKLSPLECEKLQNIPPNYTSAVSNSQRYAALGNGWTVGIIEYLLKFIAEEVKKNTITEI